MIVSPDGRHKFHVREDSPTDLVVIRETWEENVYQLGPGDFADTGVVVDIGANIGAVSVRAAALGATRIIAVEPEPANRELLSRNVEGSPVAIEASAVSDQTGRARISAMHGGARLGRKGTTVDTVSLAELFDRWDIDECDVLKIDVEGSEYPIIAGADLETLSRVRYLTMEFDAAPDDVFGPVITKLCKLFNTHVIGSPERGGYFYGRRY